jgi:DNA-directed RNA polymerase subunit F
MRLLREELITNAEAKKVVDKIGSPDDMKYEQKNAYESLKKFVVVDPKQIEALVEELKKMNKLRDRNIVAIANMLPEDTDDLRAILHKEYSNFTTEEINLILESVKKVAKSAKPATKAPTKTTKTKSSKKSD